MAIYGPGIWQIEQKKSQQKPAFTFALPAYLQLTYSEGNKDVNGCYFGHEHKLWVITSDNCTSVEFLMKSVACTKQHITEKHRVQIKHNPAYKN